MTNTSISTHTSLDPASPDVAVDRIGGVDFQRIKSGWGPESTYHDLQDVSGERTPVGGAHYTAWTAIDSGSGTTDLAVVAPTAGLTLGGFSVRETTGSASGTLNLRAGTSNAGDVLVTISLAPGESTREWPGAVGIACAAGLWLERVSGDIQVVIFSKVIP